MRLSAALFALGAALAQPPSKDLQIYRDPGGRFEFKYPSAFGRTSPGTDDAFRDRVTAIRFSEFSSGFRARRITLGGEAVLTRGSPLLDLQAAGGLYNDISLQIFPQKVAALVRSAMPVLTAANLCDALDRKQHLDPADSRLSFLTPEQRNVLPRVDAMGNIEPAVTRCEVARDTVSFDKESATVPGGVRRHIYGAVRFLSPPYSTFQLIRGSDDAPAAELLQQITAVVNSWRATK